MKEETLKSIIVELKTCIELSIKIWDLDKIRHSYFLTSLVSSTLADMFDTLMKSSESEEELEALTKYKLKYEKSKDKSALKFNLVNSLIETKEHSI